MDTLDLLARHTMPNFFLVARIAIACATVACTTDETKLWLSLFAKQRQNPCSGSHLCTRILIARHDWPVKKCLPVKMKGNSKRTSGNSLCPLDMKAQNKDLGTACQTLLTRVKLHLHCRLEWQKSKITKTKNLFPVPWSGHRSPSCYVSSNTGTKFLAKLVKF